MTIKYELTEEGKKFLKEGLPENKLIEIVEKEQEVEIFKLKKEIDALNIALKWAKDFGWIRIEKGKVFFLKKTDNPFEKLLKDFSQNKPLSDKELTMLEKRGLIKKVVKGIADELVGKEVAVLHPDLIKTGLWRKVKLIEYDVKEKVEAKVPGKEHPYRQVINYLRQKLIELGFVEHFGPYVELNFWNCDALFMPSDHPARGIHDIFYVKKPKYGKIIDKELWRRVGQTHKNGWKTGSKGWGAWDARLAKRLILRSQTTALSARTLYNLPKTPYKMFTIDKVFRPDVIDAKHFIEFEQCEGIVVDEDLNFRNLLAYLKEIIRSLDIEKVRFKPSYFPFTEPSVEGMVWHEELGWIEVLPGGIFRPEVTLPLGIDKPVLAWGIGIGRLAMIKLGIDDIRMLYSDDLGWLRDKELI